MKKKVCAMMIGSVLLCGSSSVYGEVRDYQAVEEASRIEEKALQVFQTEDGDGNAVSVAAVNDVLYVVARTASVYAKPGANSEILNETALGDTVLRNAVCDNGWSKVSYEINGNSVIGYMQNQTLSDREWIAETNEEAEVGTDTDVLDYPSRKDGEVIGEVLELDQVIQTGTVDGIWSRISYTDGDESVKTGYIPTSCLKYVTKDDTEGVSSDTETDAGTIHESSGTGIFADALKDEEPSVTQEGRVQVGTPVAASSDANLKNLGVFKITHYCPCSICCGPFADGITSTGVTAVTNHTIAVDPTQIPYGSQVVINGQVYVAEDCGGAIKKNCIDIYVATHDEGENKGVYYTEVYLIQ